MELSERIQTLKKEMVEAVKKMSASIENK